MEQKILIFKLLFLLFIIFFNFSVFSKTINGIALVVDGDTLHIEKNKIRLHGIDAPEIDQTCTINDKVWHCGLESISALKKLVLNNIISCVVSDIDKYKRYIAELLSSGVIPFWSPAEGTGFSLISIISLLSPSWGNVGIQCILPSLEILTFSGASIIL